MSIKKNENYKILYYHLLIFKNFLGLRTLFCGGDRAPSSTFLFLLFWVAGGRQDRGGGGQAEGVSAAEACLANV